MDQKDLKAIIEQVLAEMNIWGAAAETAASAAQAACCAGSAPVVEDGCIPDVTEVNIRTQYLVKNPEHGEEYAELKANAPCRLASARLVLVIRPILCCSSVPHTRPHRMSYSMTLIMIS